MIVMVWYAPSTWFDDTTKTIRQLKSHKYHVSTMERPTDSPYRNCYEIWEFDRECGYYRPAGGIYRKQDGSFKLIAFDSVIRKIVDYTTEKRVCNGMV